MATLIFSTVGTVLGGPIGGAIGALIGQSIDQQLLAPANRGPHLGDLSVQTSSYGTLIPRIYGTMRAAGSVVWATDLVESTQTTGAKGQPDATYSYSVSFAVALSSRRVASIGRIWADGKLLRGAEGDFKVSTTFRFYDGSEDQVVDPLIGSIEDLASTPALRGLALAVFENLELAEFGNRIPFLTFEIIADEAAPDIVAILEDASNGTISCAAPQSVGGYAAYGRSIRAAVEPLVSSYAIALFDDGAQLRAPPAIAAQFLGEDDLGNSADGQRAPRMEREQLPVRAVPTVLRLSYYDPARDYQSGEARSNASDQRGNEQQQELPAAVSADDAKSLAQQLLARSWAQRDRLTLRLPPRLLSLEPGTDVELALSPQRWTVEKCTVDGFVVVAELRPAWSPAVAIAAEAGRIAASNDVVAGEVSVALLDVPDVLDPSSSEPTLLLAASTPTSGWKRCAVEVSYSGQTLNAQTARRKSVLGHATTALAAGEPFLIDAASSVDIELIDADQWLVSVDDDALASGANLAAIGSELIQFGQVTPIGTGGFRLSWLLRGRGGTEWATGIHASGETFALIERDALQAVKLPLWVTGSSVTASPRIGPPSEVVLSAESLRPPAPIRVEAVLQPSGDLRLTWTRRSRRGWAWIDEVDAPIGESKEEYLIIVAGSSASIEVAAEQTELTVAAAVIATLGAGPATVQVRQIGDCAASRAAELNINL